MRRFLLCSLALFVSCGFARAALAQHHGGPIRVAVSGYWPGGYGGGFNAGYRYGGGLVYGYGVPVYGFSPYYVANGYGSVGPFWLPPVTVPASNFFGPQPIQQMMGVGPNLNAGGPAGFMGGGPVAVAAAGPGAGPAGGPIVGGGPAAADAAAPAEPHRLKVRVANVESRIRAGKLLDLGDSLFAKQQFLEALERLQGRRPASA